jgi:ABC-type bacteriocin/lantibiotic exporter with double-glycine peptidase domain
MGEAQPLLSFPPEEALWRLLVVRGHEGGLQAFKEVLWAGPEPEAMAETLEAQGIQARAALVQGEDLRYLELPTLVEALDRSWFLLEAVAKGRFQVATTKGSIRLPAEAFQAQLTGRVLDLAPTLPPGATLWARLKALFLHRRQALLQAGAATLLLQGLALATPALTALVMDRALPDGAHSLLLLVMAGLLLVTAYQVWLGWIRDRILLFVATRVSVSAEQGFLEQVLRCPFPFLQSRTLGDLMQAFAGFAAARDLLPLKTVGVFLNGALAFGYLGVMFFVLPAPTLLILLITAVIALATLGAGRLEAKLEARQVEARAREHGLLIELVAGITTLKGAGAEAKGLARWQGAFRKVLLLELARGRVNLWAGLGLGSVGQALSMVLLIWGGHHLLMGTLKAGRLFAYLQLSSGFMASAQAVVQTFLTLMILKPQLAKAQEILAVEPEPRSRPRPSAPGPVPVVMEDVWFRYAPEAPWILKGYALRVEAGATWNLSGPSGFGKTTVLRLLAGLHTPERGTILLGGHRPGAARADLVYLPQFVRVFGGTVLENLRVFSCGAPLERLLEAADQTGLQALVATFPMGYQTLLPHGGGSLSGGQRQLIALTGALAARRPLLLLDEALANVDAGQSRRLQDLIAGGPWTVVAASHGTVR